MDQFISVMGKVDCALLLDCRNLAIKHISMLRLDDYVFLITNSNAPHKLSSSAYCERRDCCYEAAKILGKKSLRDANINDIQGKMRVVFYSRETSAFDYILFRCDNYRFILTLMP